MKSKGFTLIELLVVISIIGVISSIVFVSFSGSRDKAKLAKAQNFDAQISHALGAYAVGIWRFEEGSGIDIHDESGYGNNGTFVGNPTPVFPVGVYSGTTALQFDGSNDYVDCGSGTSFNITDKITISAWVKWEDSMYGYVLNMLTDKTDATTSKINMAVAGTGNGIGADIGEVYIYPGGGPITLTDIVLTENEWTHLVFTRTGTGADQAYIYKNGVLSWTGTWALTANNPYVLIGAMRTTSNLWNGAIDDVRIYNEALSSAQIQQHFAAGAPAHGIAVNDK